MNKQKRTRRVIEFTARTQNKLMMNDNQIENLIDYCEAVYEGSGQAIGSLVRDVSFLATDEQYDKLIAECKQRKIKLINI